jgi:transposase-like protein
MSKKAKRRTVSGRPTTPIPSSPSVPVVQGGPSVEAQPVSKERRFSARRKSEAVTRLLRGEALDALSRELGVTAATLSSWRDAFLTAGQAALKSREVAAQDSESQKLKILVGDLTMRLEASREAVRRLRGGLPLDPRRSSP